MTVIQRLYTYLECKDCGFDKVEPSGPLTSMACPVCLMDYDRTVVMQRREALHTDRPAGHDAREAFA